MKTKTKKSVKRRSVKLPVRLNAKATRPHSTKRGKRGYSRRRDKVLIRPEWQDNEQGC